MFAKQGLILRYQLVSLKRKGSGLGLRHPMPQLRLKLAEDLFGKLVFAHCDLLNLCSCCRIWVETMPNVVKRTAIFIA